MIAWFRADVDLPKNLFYEKVLFFTQLSYHLMCKLLKKILHVIYWILTIHKERIVWKNIFESKEMVFKNGVKLYKLWVIMAHVQNIWQFVCSEAPIHTWRARIETIVTQYASLKMLLRKWFWPFDKAAWRGRLLSGIWEKLRMEALVTITVLCGYFIGHFIARLKRLVKLNRYWF